MTHRLQQDREDLLKEATGLVDRVELKLEAFEKNIVIGFRAGGGSSFYFGSDPVYHFNRSLKLRRLFQDGQHYKATQGNLARLIRDPDAPNLKFSAHELSTAETDDILARMNHLLRTLRSHLEQDRYTLLGQIPEDGNSIDRLQTLLPRLLLCRIADAPHADGKQP